MQIIVHYHRKQTTSVKTPNNSVVPQYTDSEANHNESAANYKKANHKQKVFPKNIIKKQKHQQKMCR